MIISKEIEVKIGGSNFKLYKELGYIFKAVGDVVSVKIEDVSKGSHSIVEVECDFCFKKDFIEYKKYNRSLKNNVLYSCSKKCSALRLKNKLIQEYNVANIAMLETTKEKIQNTNVLKYGSKFYFGSEDGKTKIKKTLIEKYDVDNPQKNKYIHDKTKNTNLKKYGTSEILSSKEIRNKIDNSNLIKYGFKTPSSNDIIKNKIIKTNLNKYGFKCPLLNIDILEKAKNTLNINYQVYSPLKSEIIKNKCIQTNLRKYNVKFFTSTKDFKEKTKQTNLEKYGNEFYSKTEISRKDFIISNDKNYIKYINNGISLFKCDCDEPHNFEIKSDNYSNRSRNNLPLCTTCYPISEQNSIKELEVLKFIGEFYKGQILPGYRDNMEIDIYLPELKLGFEFNGLYWHSEEYKDKNYHLDKTLFFKKKDIRIIHIWEDDWDNKKDIIKSQIKNYLGLIENKIFARKCIIKEIQSSDFLNINHIQGNVSSSLKLGLFHNDELVSLMTFDQFEGRKKMGKEEWNLSRFCNKINYNVIGGAGRLFNYFIKTYNPSRLISYADRSWSEGNLYYQLGFKLKSETKIDYKYIVNNVRENKTKYKKSKLIKKGFIGTEKEITENLGYKRIYDCGKFKFEYLIKY